MEKSDSRLTHVGVVCCRPSGTLGRRVGEVENAFGQSRGAVHGCMDEVLCTYNSRLLVQSTVLSIIHALLSLDRIRIMLSTRVSAQRIGG